MNGLLMEGMGALALAGGLAWGGLSLRAKVRSDRWMRASQEEVATSAIRARLSREVARWSAHIAVSRVVAYDDDGVIYAARHYATEEGPETQESFTASREARRLTDPRYALPAPLIPPAGFRPAILPRGRVTSDTLPRRTIPWSSVVGHVEGLPDEPHGRITEQLRAIHREQEGASA